MTSATRLDQVRLNSSQPEAQFIGLLLSSSLFRRLGSQEFDQVPVGIAKVDRMTELVVGGNAFDRSLDNFHAVTGKQCLGGLDVTLPSKAQIGTSRTGVSSNEINAVALLMDIEDRRTNRDSLDGDYSADFVGFFDPRSEAILEKAAGRIEIGCGQNDMIESLDRHSASKSILFNTLSVLRSVQWKVANQYIT